MKTRNRMPAAILMSLLITCSFLFQQCNKSSDDPLAQNEEITSRRKPPPPPPVYFFFSNCTNPTINGNFVAGTPTSATITLNYINSPGGSYPAYNSATVNGIKLSAPAGTLATGSGSITFTASGTPVTPGNMNISVGVGGIIPCNLQITVLNAPLTPGNCSGDPGPIIGSTGCVTFTYRGQQVTYSTVRAADGKIWLRQNLGSPQVAVTGNDVGSYGHYFQWGRWDDGHQVPTGPSITGSSLLQNPSHITGGNPNFIKGSTAATAWWGAGGTSTNTWSGTTASATNGKDPCTALGAGWHMPSAAEWTNVINAEFISDNLSAFDSRLKLTESGYRNSSTAAWTPNFVGGLYWTSTANGSNAGSAFLFDAAYNADMSPISRGLGLPCRCIK
jgi:hypothetical protein